MNGGTALSPSSHSPYDWQENVMVALKLFSGHGMQYCSPNDQNLLFLKIPFEITSLIFHHAAPRWVCRRRHARILGASAVTCLNPYSSLCGAIHRVTPCS